MHYYYRVNIYTSAQIKELEKRTVEATKISWAYLMERAAKAFLSQLNLPLLKSFNECAIYCGPGNNGGDGILIAKYLARILNIPVNLFLFDMKSGKTELRKNQTKTVSYCKDLNIYSIDDHYIIPRFIPNMLVIDALFGIGLKRPLSAAISDFVRRLNESGAYVVSVDIPSGMYADKANLKDEIVVDADEVITFQFPKPAFFLPESLPFIGKFKIAEIGLMEYPDEVSSSWHMTTKESLKKAIKYRHPCNYKGDNGRTLIVGGSEGMYGAPLLAALSSLPCGSGYSSVLMPKDGAKEAWHKPEILTLPIDSPSFIDEIPIDIKYTFGIGPGLGIDKVTALALDKFLRNYEMPVVLDADALNIISSYSLLQVLPKNSILTPHIGEFSRLAGSCSDSLKRVQRQVELSVEHEIIIVLKGPKTSISSPDGHVYFNMTGNPALAVSGTGDVLTGMITSYLAQGFDPLIAAQLGVFLHGLAADIYIQEHHESTLTANLLIKYIIKAIDDLYGSNSAQATFSSETNI